VEAVVAEAGVEAEVQAVEVQKEEEGTA